MGPQEYAKAEEHIKQLELRQRLFQEVQAVMESVKDIEKNKEVTIEEIRAAKEMLTAAMQAAIHSGVPQNSLKDAETRRRKLHNVVEDMKGSIRVFCRVRPLSSREKGLKDYEITHAVDSTTIEIRVEKQDKQEFVFDSVFMPGTQEEVFEDCLDLVQSVLDGYNVTMFAYGQTGAGKTFTMYGTKDQKGTTPRTIQELFSIIQREEERYQFTVMGSMMELYRNDLVDLLTSKNSEKNKINVRQDKMGAVQIENLIEEECKDDAALTALLERGNKQRTVAATAMNSESSRSHLLVLIKVVSVNRETRDLTKGKILMVDLAGSERLKKSEVTGDMQKEAIEINKSLTALGDVIEALTKNAKSVPYRNHKLTQVMSDALGGSSKTLMFVNASPASSNHDETLQTMKYATRAKHITNDVKKKKG